MYKETRAKKYDDEKESKKEKETKFINGLKNIITKINTEFYIKKDILNNRISFILNLDKILNKQWSFLIFENIYTKKNNKRTLTNHIYYKCTVNTNGVINFFKFDDFTENLSRCDYFIREIVCVEKPGNGFLKSGEQYEGFMYSENGNIHRIIRTNLYSLPNGELLKENLKKSYSGNQINSVDLKKYYNSFVKDNYGIKDIDKLELNINKLNGRLSYKEILKTFSSDEKKENKLTMRSGVLKKFNRYLHSNYGIMLHSEQRDSSYDYQTENINGVKYYFSFKEEYNNHVPVGYKMDSVVYLAAGNKNKKTKLMGAPILREIIAEDKIEFTDILSMLDGSFLRGKGTYTVLPVFFKYLNEYFNMQATERDFEEDTTADDDIAENLEMDNVQQLSLNFD